MKPKKIKFIALMMVLSLLLVACGGGGETTPNGQTGPSDDPAVEPGEKIIRMSVSGTPRIDPAVSADGGSTIAHVNIYDSLVYPTPEGSVEPSLATDWEISEDGLTYTFNIREGVKFHNGNELKANDVAFSMNRLLTIGEGAAYLFKGYVEEAVAVDDYVVDIKLSQTFGPFLNVLTKLYIINEEEVMANMDPSGPYGEFGDYGRQWMMTNDAGTGAYYVTDIQEQGYLLAERFEDYWKGWDNPDAPDVIRLIDNTEASTIRTMVGNRELEITDEWQSTENINAMSRMEGVSVSVLSAGMTQNMMYNTKLAPTDDVNFRKALSYLFDYEMISNQILVDSPVSIGPVSADTPGAHPSLYQYHYNLDKAREHLEQSQYGDQLDQYPVELFVNSDVADHEKIALALQAAAQQVGVTVSISKGPWLTIQERVASVESTPNAICISVAPHYMEAGSMLATRYHSNSTGTWEQAEWLMDDEIDSMIMQAIGTVDREERFEKYYEIQEKLVDLAPTAWLVDLMQRHVYQSDYVYWPVAEEGAKGNVLTLPMGYAFDFREFKVFPDQVPGR